MSGGASSPASIPSRNTHRITHVTVFYRWHPLHGQTLDVVGVKESGSGRVYYCEHPNGTRLGIPSWMLEAGDCSQMQAGDPVVAVEALEELCRLVQGQGVGQSPTGASVEASMVRNNHGGRSDADKKTSGLKTNTAGPVSAGNNDPAIAPSGKRTGQSPGHSTAQGRGKQRRKNGR